MGASAGVVDPTALKPCSVGPVALAQQALVQLKGACRTTCVRLLAAAHGAQVFWTCCSELQLLLLRGLCNCRAVVKLWGPRASNPFTYGAWPVGAFGSAVKFGGRAAALLTQGVCKDWCWVVCVHLEPVSWMPSRFFKKVWAVSAVPDVTAVAVGVCRVHGALVLCLQGHYNISRVQACVA
jgi:hypothetical protein